VLPYLHPVVGAFTVLLLVYVGSLGLRARSDRRRAPTLLAQHARLAPILYALILVSWVGGALSTWSLRRDLEFAASPHFRIGIVLVLALSGSVVTSRLMRRRAMRAIHPWFGAAAMLLAAAQLFFGLQIAP